MSEQKQKPTPFVAPDPHIERQLPHNEQGEREILGAILLDNSALADAKQILAPEDFFLMHNRKIFWHMLVLAEKRETITTVTLLESLTRAGELNINDIAAYLSQLPDGLPRATNVEHHARIVKEHSSRRVAICCADAILQAAFARDDVAEIQKHFAESAELIRPIQEQVTTVTAKELCAMDVKPRRYLLNGLIRERSMSELYSWRGVGKTFIALGIGDAIAAGGKFLKWEAPEASDVLFVDGELGHDEMKKRLLFLGYADNENLHLLSTEELEDPFPHLASARAQRIIEDKIGETCARFLILDNLAALAPASNEKESEEWTQIQTWLRALKRQGISTLFLQHAGYSGHARGTTRREDLLDVVVELKHPKDHKAPEGLRIEINFTKTRGLLSQFAEPLEASLTTDLDGNALWTYRDLEDVRVLKIIELKDAGHSWREIESLTDIPRSTAERLYRNAR